MHRLAPSLLFSLFLAACGDNGGASTPDAAPQPTPDAAPKAVAIQFAVKFGATPFACGVAVPAMGSPAASYTPTDARFYVHDVELLDADGAVPVTLDANAFQGNGVALMDFEDGCGSDGTAELHTAITGTVPDRAYVGVRFTLGVPADQNFVDLASAPAPLNVTGMYWIWQFGYKFLKLDGTSTAPFFLHLGSSGCPGANPEAPPTGPCANPNTVTYTLTGFDPWEQTVVADLGAVLATSDLTTNTTNTAPGCMSEPDDPECLAILPRLGIGDITKQTLFKVE
ncbi:MAG: metallo-mystery pair system four-Cys motif protein [Deltaproteobacteria bacterium]|nr:metallo-mystery pair system four-Cys motif protein [Deltaproteobacteria bacterium]